MGFDLAGEGHSIELSHGRRYVGVAVPPTPTDRISTVVTDGCTIKPDRTIDFATIDALDPKRACGDSRQGELQTCWGRVD